MHLCNHLWGSIPLFLLLRYYDVHSWAIHSFGYHNLSQCKYLLGPHAIPISWTQNSVHLRFASSPTHLARACFVADVSVW